MMPSAEDMLQAARQALHDVVAPHVQDQWAASALRSVDAILSHLMARAPVEGPMLHQDTTDLAALMAEVEGKLGLGGDYAAFATEAATVLRGYASVADLAAINLRGLQLVDTLLLLCRARRDEGPAGEVHAALTAYLLRHAERESSFFFPVYVGRPL